MVEKQERKKEKETPMVKDSSITITITIPQVPWIHDTRYTINDKTDTTHVMHDET
jgi:hypothetical protein